jgi:hypothetical protein
MEAKEAKLNSAASADYASTGRDWAHLGRALIPCARLPRPIRSRARYSSFTRDSSSLPPPKSDVMLTLNLVGVGASLPTPAARRAAAYP